jgi:hypothetical protein
MKIGDQVKYTPRELSDIDKPIAKTTITKLMEAGSVFNQDMAVIEGVDHWVPVCDLDPV